MRVLTYGLQIKAGHVHTSLADVMNLLKAESGKPDDTQAIQRRFYLDDQHHEFYRGMVITVRDQRTFCKWVESGGGDHKIHVENLGEAEKVMDFNLFVVNKANGLGLYQYYFRSCPISTFVTYLKRRYRTISFARRDAEIKKADLAGEGKKVIKAIKSKYAEPLRGGPMVSPANFASVVAQYGDIRSFSFEITSMEHRSAAAGPLDPYVKRVRQTVSFMNDSKKLDVVKAIVKSVPLINAKTARVSVVDVDDEESVQIRLQDIPEAFEETDYDYLASELQDLSISNFASTGIIFRLIKECEKRPELFNQKFED